MNILFLKGFNNYFNRIVKKYSTLTDYQNNSSSFLNYTSINFNPNDGVATELIIGSPSQQEPGTGSSTKPLTWDINGTPDYAVCYENEGTPTVAVIKHRWFVMEAERTRDGQYRLALKRDVLADHINEVLNAPCFVEKGIVNDVDNTLLYNNEGLTYNQIKKDEILLEDPTETGWIVGYVAKNYNHTSGLSQATISAEDADPIDYIDEEDLPFTVSTSGPSTVISADATKTDLNIMLPIAWVDARYGGWGSVNHRRKQSFNIYNNGWLAVANDGTGGYNNQPYYIKDGSLATSTIESYSYTAESFLAGGTFNGTSFGAMNSAFNLQDVSDGRYLACTNNINANLTLNVNMSGVISDPTKIVAVVKKYAADPSDISGGTFGNANRNLYVDYAKAIGSTAYSQMKTYYTNNYGWSTLMNYYNGKLATDLSGYNACIKTATVPAITSYNGKVVKIGTKFYKMYITSANSYHVILRNTSNERMPTYTVNGANTLYINTDSSTTANNYMNNIINSFANGVKDDQSNKLMTAQTSWKAGCAVIEILPKYNVNLEEIATEDIMMGNTSETFSSFEYTQGTTYDAPYDMFAIPYGRLAFKCSGGNTTYYTSKSEGIGIARWLAQAMGSANVYDLQIMPYCPSSNVRDYMASNNVLDLGAISSHYQIIFRAPPGSSVSTPSLWSPCSFIMTALSCKGTFDIEKEIDVPDEDWSNPLNYKIANETQLVRLCSPNWGSMFEFSLAKNQGVTKFNIDYTYKPYQPYVHINPDFKGLYGTDWDDSRGLILGGDFSIQTVDSAWTDYVNNNKNYQSIFNRQIDNLDVNQQIEYEQHLFNNQIGIATGSIGGMAGGAMTGMKMGGPYGAAAGAILGFAGGTALATAGGFKDMEWLRRSQAETKDYTIDMYNYNLGNIKARPDSLARTEALNNNNKIFPVIELYSCTDLEKTNLANKIRYNGMTIMAIGTLADYSYSVDFNLVYVKGQLVRCENIADDFHVVDAIFQEVNKGFFVVQGV